MSWYNLEICVIMLLYVKWYPRSRHIRGSGNCALNVGFEDILELVLDLTG